MRLHAHSHGPWHLPAVDVARALRQPHVRGAASALALAALAALALQLAPEGGDPLGAVAHWATRPFTWFVENVVAYAYSGFAR